MIKSKSIIGWFLAVGILLIPAVFLCGCSKDEPQRAEGIQVPSGPRDDVNGDGREDQPGEKDGDNDSTGNNDDVGNSGIIGHWEDQSGKISFTFDDAGKFQARVTQGMGFVVTDSQDVYGTYIYDDFKRWIWLTVKTEAEIYVVEFKCVIDGDRMSLYPEHGNGYILWRK